MIFFAFFHHLRYKKSIIRSLVPRGRRDKLKTSKIKICRVWMAVIAVLLLVLLDCDYYRFKELDSGAVNAYQNEYMSQYYRADFLYDEDFY